MTADSADRPRLLQLIDSLEVGGPSSVVSSLALGLRRRGWEVRVAHLGIGDGSQVERVLDAGSVPVDDLELRGLVDLRALGRLVRLLRSRRIGLVHSHNRYAHLIGRLAAALAGVPIVSTVHYLVDQDIGRRARVRRLADDLTALWLCARVVLVAEASRQRYAAQSGVPTERLAVVRNGVDTGRFQPSLVARSVVRSSLGIGDEEILFTCLAMLRAGKGLEELLHAFAVLTREGVPARLLVVGDGPQRAALLWLAASLGIAGRVHLTGIRSDVEHLLAASDALVLPSHHEAMPLSLLEGMASGLAVIATSVGGVPEVVIDGVTGLLLPAGDTPSLADQMRRLLVGELRRELGSAARRWVEQNASLERWLDEHERLYRLIPGETALTL